ncbi:hypothetical protein M1615_01400 [Patescibacteria group bacterium]|nr:hypothetical protein [Patescibacteria group bacterium]MCL5010244.1 hypothetical protein [Patescibacteria group bacterium]
MKKDKAPAALLLLLLFISFLGFLDLSYLTILHYKNVIPSCSLTNGCETVLISKYATILGLPISLIGSLYYLILIGLSSIFIYGKSVRYKIPLLLLTGLGLAISLIYLSIQLFILKAICQYCGLSDLMALGVFLLSLII